MNDDDDTDKDRRTKQDDYSDKDRWIMIGIISLLVAGWPSPGTIMARAFLGGLLGTAWQIAEGNDDILQEEIIFKEEISIIAFKREDPEPDPWTQEQIALFDEGTLLAIADGIQTTNFLESESYYWAAENNPLLGPSPNNETLFVAGLTLQGVIWVIANQLPSQQRTKALKFYNKLRFGFVGSNDYLFQHNAGHRIGEWRMPIPVYNFTWRWEL